MGWKGWDILGVVPSASPGGCGRLTVKLMWCFVLLGCSCVCMLLYSI